MLGALAVEAVKQNTLTKEEEHGIRWLVKNSNKKLGGKIPMDCDYCNKPEARKRFDSEEERKDFIQQTKREYGCIGKALRPFKFANDDGVYDLYTCPHKLSKESGFGSYFRAYAWFDHKGIFPFGSFEDQSEKLITAFEIIRTEHRRNDQEILEREK